MDIPKTWTFIAHHPLSRIVQIQVKDNIALNALQKNVPKNLAKVSIIIPFQKVFLKRNDKVVEIRKG